MAHTLIEELDDQIQFFHDSDDDTTAGKTEMLRLQSAGATVPGTLAVTGATTLTGALTATGGITGAMAATGAVSGTTLTATTGAVSASNIKTASVSLTNAEIKALRAAPKTIVAAAGSNIMLHFLDAVLVLTAGSEALTESADNLALKYTDGSGDAVSGTIEATGFIDQTADTLTNAVPASDAIHTVAEATNAAIVLHNTGDGEYAGNASNDATMTVHITYREYDLS